MFTKQEAREDKTIEVLKQKFDKLKIIKLKLLN